MSPSLSLLPLWLVDADATVREKEMSGEMVRLSTTAVVSDPRSCGGGKGEDGFSMSTTPPRQHEEPPGRFIADVLWEPHYYRATKQETFSRVFITFGWGGKINIKWQLHSPFCKKALRFPIARLHSPRRWLLYRTSGISVAAVHNKHHYPAHAGWPLHSKLCCGTETQFQLNGKEPQRFSFQINPV